MLIKAFETNDSYRGTINVSDTLSLPAYFKRDYVPSRSLVNIIITGMFTDPEGYPKCFFVRERSPEDDLNRVYFEGFNQNGTVFNSRAMKFGHEGVIRIHPGNFYHHIRRNDLSKPKAKKSSPLYGGVGIVSLNEKGFWFLEGLETISSLSIKERV